MGQIDLAIPHRCMQMDRFFDSDVSGNVDEVPIAPHGRLQGSKPIAFRTDQAVQILFDQRRVVSGAA